MLLSMIFEYDCDMDIEAYIALASAPRQVDERNASLSWIPPQKQQFAVLKDTPEVHANVISLKDFGCEYEIAVKSGFSESGDLERRTLFRDVMLMCVDQGVSLAGVGVGGNEGEGPHVTESKEWYIYTLRRMSCQHIERVMAAVRKRKHFSDDRNDAIVHRDVLFIAYCGLKAKMTYHSKMVELFSPPQPDSCATMNMYDNVNRHPMVPPDELNELFNSVDSGNVFSWPSFYRSMCSSSSSEAQKYAFPVARYASALVRFLIPVYTFSLGPIPDPALWEFEFSASDVEALYHGDCNDARLRIVKESLMAKNCPDLAVDSLSASGAEGLRTQMWNLAYATHVLLWGLLSNDRRLMNLFRANHKLLGALDTVYSPTNDVAPNAQTCFYYLRDIRNFARTARRCQCANRPPWLQAFHQPQCDARHDFWSSIRREHYNSHPSYTELDKEIRQEILIWGDNELLDVVWQHCNDRVVTVQNEFGGSRTLRKHWNTIELLYRESTLWLGSGGRHHDTAAFHSFLLSLLLGTDLPTSDPHHGEGYDRMVAILTASIRKLVLDVRLCHDNYHTMHLKYWRYSASERSLISIPYGRNVIIVRDVQPKRLNNSRIVDIGLNLNGLYHISETPSSQIYELNHEIELEYLSNEQLQKYPHSPAPLRQFLLDTAWKRDGSYVLHGFCDDSSGSVHEVKISVTLPHIFRKGGGQFEDLEFSVRIDNEDTQRCTIITVNAPVMSNNFSGGQGASPVTDRYVAFLQNQSTSFLRLGIQLHDVGIAVPHDHVVRESSECLGAALDGEKQLESENRKVLEAAHRSRAMQLSPEMLEYLPNTNRGLRDFLRTNIESQMPELMHFFANPCVTILGLASREIPHAKTVLQEALYTVIDMSIDDLSFATTYDAIKNFGTMSAISILHLSILSPLSAECLSKLVNVTVKTSLRFIVEVSGLTIPLFSIDRTTTRCIVQLLEHRVALIDQNSKLGNVIVNASNQVMNAPMFGGLHNALREDCENTLQWSLQQNEALSLLRARDMAMTQRFTEVTATNNGQIISSNKLVVVVNGDRSLLDAQANETTARDCWYQDLKRVANQRECIQQLLWAHQEIPVVLALHSLDQTAPFLFFRTESKMDNEVLEPVVFRPDLVISNRTPLEDRFALILGCRKDEYLSKVDTAPVRELATVLGSVRINSVIPTFEAFLRETPFMELMSHVLRVSIYLYYIVGITRPQQFHLVVEMVQGLCHNNFTRTVWDSICWEVPRVIQREPAYLESDYFHSQKSAFSFTAIDSTVANELKDNHPICVSVLEKWFTQLPSSNAIRQYMSYSMTPLTAFLINPATVVSLLRPTRDERNLVNSGYAPSWASRLAHALHSRTFRHVHGENNATTLASVEQLLSAVRWVSTMAGGGRGPSNFSGKDFDNISILGIVASIFLNAELTVETTEINPTSYQHTEDDHFTEQEKETIRLLLALDSKVALLKQHQLRDLLMKRPSAINGRGMSRTSARQIVAKPDMIFGALFVDAVVDAENGAGMVCLDEVREIVDWCKKDLHPQDVNRPNALARNSVVQRMTNAARMQFILRAVDGATRKWERLSSLFTALGTLSSRQLDQMVSWVRRDESFDSFSSCESFVVAKCVFQSMLGSADTSAMTFHSKYTGGFGSLWPLDLLDQSEGAAEFFSQLCSLFVKTVTFILFGDVSQQNDRVLIPSHNNFARACTFISLSTTHTSQRRVMSQLMFLCTNCDETTHLDKQVLKWVYAALWICCPLGPALIDAVDTEYVILISEYLANSDTLQTRFEHIIQDNFEAASPLALALIGWLEYVPTIMLHLLGRIRARLCNGSAIASIQSLSFSIEKFSNVADFPLCPVTYCARGIPAKLRSTLFERGMAQWIDRELFEKATPITEQGEYCVASGASRKIVLSNLAYLNFMFNFYSNSPGYDGPMGMPTDVFLGVKMTVLWFALMSVSTANICELFNVQQGAPVGDRFFRFLTSVHHSSSHSLSVMPPLVIDVCIQRDMTPTRQTMQQLYSEGGRSRAYEMFVAPLPPTENEKWAHMTKTGELTNTTEQQADFEEHVKDFANISAKRFAACCDCTTELHLAFTYANAVLHPCVALHHLARPDLALLFCQVIALASCTTPFHRGLIALTTLSQRMFDLLEVVGGEGRTIPNSVKKSILYFLCERQPHTTLVQGWPIDGGEAPQGGPSSAEELSTVITPLITDLTVLSANLGRLSSRATRSVEDLGEVCAPEVVQQVSVFSRPPTTTLDLDSLVGSGSAAFDDGNDDSVVAHLNTEFAQKQISGRSINVSLILRLQWESASFYLTLYVTPGGVCYMVEREGNLEMSSDVRNCRVVNVFKSHGDAWNYCKARYGPVSLAGEGFFLYRSKANSGGWRFFLGNSVELRPTLSSPLPGDSPSEPRFYIWHIAAYHSVLCLRLDSALKELLHIICKHVFLTAFAQNEETQSLTDDERMTRVLTSLVCSRGDQFDKARSVALPLLAYCRLLLLAANAMRRSGHNDTNRHSSTQQWSFSLVEFQAQFKTALAPQRVGTVYDAEIDALSLINGLTVIYPPKTFFPEGSEKADTSEKADPAFCFPRDVQSMALNKELEGHIDILPTLKKPDSKEILFSALSDPILRTGVLDCVRRLSSSTDIKFVQAVLSENRHSSERLHHFELAFCPLPVSHVWNMLGNWIKYSVNGIAELEAKRQSTTNSSTAPQRETSIANAIHETHMNELRKSRQAFFGEAQKIRNYLRDPPVGEGVGRRLSNEVEHCWTHASTHQIPSSSNTDESATLAERPSPHIIWRDYEPDGFSVDRGEHVAFILDTLFCYRNPHDEGTPPLLVTGAMRFTSFESEELFFEVTQEKVESAQADDVTFLAHIPTIAEQQRLTIRRDAACVRLQRSDGLMLSCTRRFGCDGGNDSHAWEFCKPSKNSDEQFFTLSMVSAPKSAAVRKSASRLEDQFRAQMFRWVVTIIGSPMSVQWKLFFVHHMHVHSRKQAPTNASSLIAYCIANLCPAQRLRDQLLGALNFSPTRFCRRRDRHFGVVVTSHIPDLQSSEWSQLDKVGPITLSAAPEAEQYRELTKKFSFATTHVIVVGMSTVKDQLLKWCCELTKRYPWRFILFVQCDIRSNAPENRDRIVDLSETIFDKPDICRVSFDPMVREKYISRQQESSTIHSIVSNRVRDWPIKLLQFLKRPKTPIRQSQISEATHQARRQPQQRVVLIVSPPGGGKSMELRNLEFDLSTNNNEGSTFRIINFDCSGDALVHRALWTLLNDAVAGIELGGDNVVLVVDEYHMLSRAKKIEFIRWAESRIGDIKIVLLANRDDPDDEALDERLNNVSGQSTISIIQRARISICKMVEALSTVRMTAPASIHRAVTFLCATRLLISDDAISLRMTPDFSAAPYASESGRPPTPLEASVRAKLHAENYVFVSMMMRRFDTIYDGLPSAAARSDVVRAFNIMFSSRGSLQHQKSNDPISVLVFTAMLPTLLLWGESSKSVANISPVDSDDHSTHDDNDCEALPTFVEFVGSTSAYNVHPAVRFGSWVHYILTELNHHRALTMPESSSTAVGTATNHALQLHVPSINDLIKLMATLETLDHPAFFPLIFKTIDAPADLNFCDTVIQTHPNSFESLYDAVVRHEAVDWNAIRIQWVHEPLTVDELLKLANPSVIAPETVLRQLAANTLFGLLHREQGRAHGQLHSTANATSARTISDQPQTDWSGSAAALRNLVLTYYPKDLIAREGDTRASPYFWSVWQATVLLPLDEALWIECVTKYIPFDDTASDHPSAFAGTGTRGRFVMWASAYGQSSGVFDDADVRTTVCIRVLAQLAKGYLTEEQWAHFARENFVAPALCLRTSSGSEVLDIDFAFKIATAPLPPHPLWSHDMTLLARLRNRDTLLSGNESAKLFVSMGSSISPTTPPRVIGAMLQSSPSGMLPIALQNALLSAPIEVTDNDLCSEVTDDVIYRNVAEGLSKRKMQTNGCRTNEANDEIHLTGSRVQSILQAFIVNVAVSPAVEREESEGAFHTPRTNLTPIEANNEVEEEQEVEEEREEGGEAQQQDNVDAEENEEGNIV